MATWNNSDGLFIRYGSDEAEPSRAGEYNFGTPAAIVEFALLWSELPAFGATDPVILTDVIRFPKKKIFIEEVEIIKEIDWDSAADAMTLTMGLYDTDRSTVYDADAFIAAATQTELNTGGKNVAGWVGSAVGTIIDNTLPLLTVINIDVATATAGQGLVRIKYHVVNHLTDTLGTVIS